MKIFLTYVCLTIGVVLATTHVSLAQTYSITPNDTFQATGIMEDLETLTISQLNISSDTITLAWKKVSASVPVAWEASVCDNQMCYATLVDSGTMNQVNPSETGFVLLHITPHVNYGTATIRYAVWDKNTPDIKDTLTFIMTVSTTSGLDEKKDQLIFNVPNPITTQVITLFGCKSELKYVITDLLGREFASGTLFPQSNSITVTSLPNGAYSLSLLDNTGKISTRKFIIQH